MFDDNSGQVSTELILLMACILMVVIISISMYKNYMEDFVSDINNTDVNILKNKIDKMNDYLK